MKNICGIDRGDDDERRNRVAVEELYVSYLG